MIQANRSRRPRSTIGTGTAPISPAIRCVNAAPTMVKLKTPMPYHCVFGRNKQIPPPTSIIPVKYRNQIGYPHCAKCSTWDSLPMSLAPPATTKKIPSNTHRTIFITCFMTPQTHAWQEQSNTSIPVLAQRRISFREFAKIDISYRIVPNII